MLDPSRTNSMGRKGILKTSNNNSGGPGSSATVGPGVCVFVCLCLCVCVCVIDNLCSYKVSVSQKFTSIRPATEPNMTYCK